MEQQTALKQAINKLRGKTFPPRSNVALGVSMAINLISEFLESEKEQIAEAWNDGNLLGRNGHIKLEYDTGEQYYKEKFGSPDTSPSK